jgi:hypothetical protein
VLANASIDLAFHDCGRLINNKYEYYLITMVYIYCIYLLLNYFINNVLNDNTELFKSYIKENKILLLDFNNNNKVDVSLLSDIIKEPNYANLDPEYIEQFFVGLLDGDGSITVGLVGTNKLRIRIRIFISLKNLYENEVMLLNIQKVVGGRVYIERKNEYVTWLACSKKDLNRIYEILDKYPLLTTRKQCQLEFVKNYNPKSDISKDTFIRDRDNKYLKQEQLVNTYNTHFVPPYYFKAWLSGFVEAEGNFSLVLLPSGFISKAGFTIGQNTDLFLIKAIRDYFKSNHKIIEEKSKSGVFTYYRLSIYGPLTRFYIYKHFMENPLLGYKYNLYYSWITYFINRAKK